MFTGVIPILATPFHDDESLDLDSWQRLLEFMVWRSASNGVTILGVLGESNRLSDEERHTLIETAVTVVGGRMPIIVGTSARGHANRRYLSRDGAGSRRRRRHGDARQRTGPNEDRIVELYQQDRQEHHRFRSCCRIIRRQPTCTCPPASSRGSFASVPLDRVREGRGGADRPEDPPGARGVRRTADSDSVRSRGARTRRSISKPDATASTPASRFPKCSQVVMAAGRDADWLRVHRIYSRFAALIVFEQQPGVAIRKEFLRRRGLLASARVRHPGAQRFPRPSAHSSTPARARVARSGHYEADGVAEQSLPTWTETAMTRSLARIRRPRRAGTAGASCGGSCRSCSCCTSSTTWTASTWASPRCR